MSIDDVFKLFGEVSFQASILEEQLGNICMLNERVLNQKKYQSSDTKSIVDKFSKMTTGQLLNQIKKALGGTHDDHVDTIFKPALECRNELIHNFFIEYREIRTDNSKIPLAIDELNRIKSVIDPAANFATTVCQTLLVRFIGSTRGK